MTTFDFLRDQYQETERLAVMLRHEQAGVVNHIKTVHEITSSIYQRWLHENNAQGWNIHFSPNVLRPDAQHHRTKQDFSRVASLWADLDHDGDKQLGRIWDAGIVPKPNYIVNTSPGRYQVIWKVEGFHDQELTERMLRGIAIEFGADPSATDVSRLLRLPGFVNHKPHAGGHVVEATVLVAGAYNPSHFNQVRIDLEHTRDLIRGMVREHDRGHEHDRFLAHWRIAHSMYHTGRSREDVISFLEERAQRDFGPGDRRAYARSTAARAERDHQRVHER